MRWGPGFRVTVLFVGPALSGACVSSDFVNLGSNLDAGGGIQRMTLPLDAAAPPSTLNADESGAGASSLDDSAADTSPSTAEDSAPEASAGLCLGNPMFTGTPTDAGGILQGRAPSALLPDWQVCNGRVDVNPGVCSLPPPQGTRTYLGLPVFPILQNATATSVSTQLAALPPGTYAFSIELGLALMTLSRGGFGFGGTAPAVLTIYGSTTPCGRDEVLWSQTITNIDSWMVYQGVLTATRAFSNLVLVPSLMNASGGLPPAGAYVIVGNFVSQSQSCD